MTEGFQILLPGFCIRFFLIGFVVADTDIPFLPYGLYKYDVGLAADIVFGIKYQEFQIGAIGEIIEVPAKTLVIEGFFVFHYGKPFFPGRIPELPVLVNPVLHVVVEHGAPPLSYCFLEKPSFF